MRLQKTITLFILSINVSCSFIPSTTPSSSFSPSSFITPSTSHPSSPSSTRFASSHNDNDQKSSNQNKQHTIIKSRSMSVTNILLTALSLWSAPAFILGPMSQQYHHQQQPSSSLLSSWVANAREKASGSGSRVNKDPESLLRYGLPIDNKEVRKLQSTIEDIRLDIGSKRKSNALDGVRQTRTILNSKSSKITSSCQRNGNQYCVDIIDDMITNLIPPLESSLQEANTVQRGSEQERNALDEAYVYQKGLTQDLTKLEEDMVPRGYEVEVPKEYMDLPILRGRASVEFILRKDDGAVFDVEGVNFKEAKMKMIIDGYTAPITGGNFIDLVNKDFYTNMKIQRSDGFVVQTGDPDGEAVGYTGSPPSKSIGAGPHGERLIPLEIFLRGDQAPIYESSLEDEGRGGEATVLPFSSYGAMGWAREEYDVNSGSSQFFWLLFDSDLTPAGKNVLDGSYPCFGYVVEGADFLSAVKEGDIIVSAKVTEGGENLVMPK